MTGARRAGKWVATSAFKEWFVAQFGRYPNERKRSALFAKIHNLELELYYAKQAKQFEDWLRDAQDAALKAWNASPDRRMTAPRRAKVRP